MAAVITQAPKGTKDVLPSEVYRWHELERIIREQAEKYGFNELRTPIFEHTELFLRSVGDTTDVVQKEMSTFNDKGNRSITLKPEGTASTVRAFLEHGLYNQPLPLKTYYFTPVFRYERPQAGRLREHHQFGVEVFGAPQATLDAELIAFALSIFKNIKIDGLSVNINSIGCPECRQAYNEALMSFLESRKEKLCDTCKERLERNPLRVLDCKVPSCREELKDVPVILDYLCSNCSEHFNNLKLTLNELGISYNIDPMIVRGLDYYSKTVFEIIYTNDRNESLTVCGGGRYDGLTKQMGDVQTAGAGFGMGLERVLMIMAEKGLDFDQPEPAELFIAAMGAKAAARALKLTCLLRSAGIKAETDHSGRSVKAQLKYANKLAFKNVLVIGEDELSSGIYRLKNMNTGEECDLNEEELINYFIQKGSLAK
ncbi:MAG: histidine--tRNA ligase [Clostridiales bacterium]|nr:histidine--tRNA ligase [Clostridiales bacterium]